MSDWESCHDTLGMAYGGLDLEMPVGKWHAANKFRPLLDDGRVTSTTLGDKVRRQLRGAFEMGWFDRAQKDLSISHDDPASDAVNVGEARGGITLLKNADGLLPLDPAKGGKIVVLGPNGDHPVTGGGGSAYVSYSHAISVLDALQRVAGADAVRRLVLCLISRPHGAGWTRWRSPWRCAIPARGADAEVVQVCVEPPAGGLPRPARELKGYG